MIRKSVLRTRAAQGYKWLKKNGHHYGLDYQALHVRPELINVYNGDWCPLARANAEPRNYYHATAYIDVCARLSAGFWVPGTRTHRRVAEVTNFLVDNGFCIRPQLLGPTDRDWRALSQAWRDVIAANPLTVTAKEASR